MLLLLLVPHPHIHSGNSCHMCRELKMRDILLMLLCKSMELISYMLFLGSRETQNFDSRLGGGGLTGSVNDILGTTKEHLKDF